MVDDSDSRQPLLFDAAPLIYLANGALDVIAAAGYQGLVPPPVVAETTRPAIAFMHADALSIEQAVRKGVLSTVAPTAEEHASAGDIARRVGGLHAGECDVLAIGLSRSIPAVIFERRARRVATALGLRLVDVLELLFAGTADADLLEERVRHFARLVDIRIGDLDRLVRAVERRTES